MTLGRLLGQRFYYCEYYSIPGCCQTIPCTRTGEYARAGATLFVQKSHDHSLTDDPDAGFDGIVVQVREPVARALSNYELDLETLKLPHSESYRRFWLGLEAAYTLGFVEKWCTPRPGRLVLRYEDLLADPVAYFRRVFDTFGLDTSLFDEAALRDQLQTKAGGNKKFRVRDIRTSVYFDEADLGCFQEILRPAVAKLGYARHKLGAPRGWKAGPIALAFQAKRNIFAERFAEAVAALDAYIALPDPDPAARLLRGAVKRATGDFAGSEDDIRAYIAHRPADARGHTNLAQLQLRRGSVDDAAGTIAHALSVTDSPHILRDWARRESGSDRLRALVERATAVRDLPPEDVVAAFRIILGREPEGELVILQHRRTGGVEQLRRELLSSEEFREKLPAILAGEVPGESPDLARAATREDVAACFAWLLDRQPESEATIEAHLKHGTVGRLRAVILRAPEFRDKLARLG